MLAMKQRVMFGRLPEDDAWDFKLWLATQRLSFTQWLRDKVREELERGRREKEHHAEKDT